MKKYFVYINALQREKNEKTWKKAWKTGHPEEFNQN
jgi:predicted GIY-YIG superfamily endonuclease